MATFRPESCRVVGCSNSAVGRSSYCRIHRNFLTRLASRIRGLRSIRHSHVPKEPKVPPLWREGERNPVTKPLLVSARLIEFECSVCRRRLSVPRSAIDQRRGALWRCGRCNNRFHIPGSLGSTDITAGVRIPIANFRQWYSHHPVYVGLGEESWMLNEHGLWGFCASCHRQFATTVLTSFVNFQLSQAMRKYGSLGHIFAANSTASADEMKALQANRCPECGCDSLIGLMAEIQSDIRDRLQALAKEDQCEQ